MACAAVVCVEKDPACGPSGEARLPRIILAELQQLPSARSFPPLLGFKRDRGSSEGGGGGVQGTAADDLLSLLDRRPCQPPSQDPTAHLLSEAASQLSGLVKQQMHRRMPRASKSLRLGGSDGASEGRSSGEFGQEEEDAEDAPRKLCATFDASDSAGQSPPTAPHSQRGSLDGPSATGGKRARLQRQYAIDLCGRCMLGSGKRVPLPQPQPADPEAAE